MAFMTWIVYRFNYIGGWFYDLYIDSYYAGWPLDILADWFYYLSGAFYDLAWNFSDFGTWVNATASKLLQILDWDTIRSYILTIIPDLVEIQAWFDSWWINIWNTINQWWDATEHLVWDWVQDARNLAAEFYAIVNTSLQSLWGEWNSFVLKIPSIDAVLVWWSNWPGDVLSVVNTWWSGALLDVQALINSAFTVRESFWSGWSDWRDQVAAFFSDPEDWLYKSVDRIFERFW